MGGVHLLLHDLGQHVPVHPDGQRHHTSGVGRGGSTVARRGHVRVDHVRIARAVAAWQAARGGTVVRRHRLRYQPAAALLGRAARAERRRGGALCHHPADHFFVCARSGTRTIAPAHHHRVAPRHRRRGAVVLGQPVRPLGGVAAHRGVHRRHHGRSGRRDAEARTRRESVRHQRLGARRLARSCA